MREIFDQYGYRNRWELIENVMHKLPEWQDPGVNSIPIQVRDILEAAGESEEKIRAVLRELHSFEHDEESFARMYD